MSTPSPLETLAEAISADAKVISGYCTLDGTRNPSSGPDGPSVALPPEAPEYVRHAHQQLFSAAKEALQLAPELSEYLPMLAVQVGSRARLLEQRTDRFLALMAHALPSLCRGALCGIEWNETRA